jgi:hypothetical protein
MHGNDGAAMSAVVDVRPALLEQLKDLRLPTVRDCYEDTARRAERGGYGSLLEKNPVDGLVAEAPDLVSARPISRASRPASTALRKACAIRLGSEAIAIAVFTSTASAPISIASAA